MKRIAILTLASFALACALASCGKQAPELERPQPNHHQGPRERADEATQQRNEADTASNAAATNTPIPPQNPAIQPYTDPGPIHDNPIPGERTNPSGSPNPAPH